LRSRESDDGFRPIERRASMTVRCRQQVVDDVNRAWAAARRSSSVYCRLPHQRPAVATLTVIRGSPLNWTKAIVGSRLRKTNDSRRNRQAGHYADLSRRSCASSEISDLTVESSSGPARGAVRSQRRDSLVAEVARAACSWRAGRDCRGHNPREYPSRVGGG